MQKIQNISILLSFVSLWLTSLLPVQSELLIGYILIFSFGILHGANDLLILGVISRSISKKTFFKELFIYILAVLLGAIAFYFFPLIALILFILSSAYHFGQQHWEHQSLFKEDSLNALNYFFYGLLVLMILFYANKLEVIEIIEQITLYQLSDDFINNGMIATVILYLVLCLYSFSLKKIRNINFIKELLYIIVLTIIFKVADVIWGFAIYFIFWHSIPSLYEQIMFIYKEMNTTNFLKYCRNALPYWLISIIGIALLYYLLEDSRLFNAVLFAFIAAVTFPHTIVIDQLFKNKKAQS
ncbi:MAG: Brp/Blh family beta-carotene 15,15'-dioxygenase [bacterium]